MDASEQEDELALAKVAANLLSELDSRLNLLLFRQASDGSDSQQLHHFVRMKDLDYVVKLIEPFQSDPQLLDPHLKHIVPLIAESYLQPLLLKETAKQHDCAIELTTALSTVLYTLCKVRGRKVISGLLKSEPRYLEPILEELDTCLNDAEAWHKQYVLLLWLSHLLLAPFDLASIAKGKTTNELPSRLDISADTPPIAQQILRVCLKFLPRSAATQHVAALALSRLVSRPDMQRWQLAEKVVAYSLSIVCDRNTTESASLYPVLGTMRLLANVAGSGDMAVVIPQIYRSYTVFMADETEKSIELDAVGRSLVVKTARSIIISAVRGSASNGQYQDFLESTNVLEDIIDYLIRCLTDRETLVRHAAAKALAVIVQALGADMGSEIISTILQSLEEELPESFHDNPVRAVDANATHGYTLAIAFNLFSRSVAVDHLPRMINVLLAALAFEQRTPTGSVTGTNVRDAANFGIWSLARRYITSELLAISTSSTYAANQVYQAGNIIELVAMHLLQSACCDPIGNVRRGSSAALQELVGRHPDKIAFGIDLVQAVDYQAVGLRQRAFNDVAAQIMSLDQRYWTCLIHALLGWRGLGSADVASRDAAAQSINRQLYVVDITKRFATFRTIIDRLREVSLSDVERLHGLVLTAAMFVEQSLNLPTNVSSPTDPFLSSLDIWQEMPEGVLDIAFSPRSIRSELPVAISRLATSIYTGISKGVLQVNHFGVTLPDFAPFLEQLSGRSEPSVLAVVPPLITSLCDEAGSLPIELFDSTVEMLATKLNHASAKPAVHGAARAFALAACISAGITGDELQQAIRALQNVCQSPHVDWRTIGLKAFAIVLDSQVGCQTIARTSFAALNDVVLNGLQDYTIDERGDIGSLVRLQALQRVTTMLDQGAFKAFEEDLLPAHAAVLRLSLEKLTRVRHEAARCRNHLPQPLLRLQQISEVDSRSYFEAALLPLWAADTPSWALKALLEGFMSCAGSAPEHIVQNARSVVAKNMVKTSNDHLHTLITIYTESLKQSIDRPAIIEPALEVLSFLLQVRLLERLYTTDFKWRVLLSTVQRSHFKSTDVQRILAAVSVYVGLGEVPSLRGEVFKKVISMIRSSPYPKVRTTCADALYVLTHDEDLKKRDWSSPAAYNSSTLGAIEKRHLS